MPSRSKLQPQRIAGGRNQESKDQATDKNFDDIYQGVNQLESDVTRLLGVLGGSGGPIDLTSIYLLIQKVEDEGREFALMVGYE